MARQEKCKHKNSSLPSGFPSPPTALCICIMHQTRLPSAGTPAQPVTYSQHQQDNSLKHGIASWSYKGSHDPLQWHLDLDDVNRSIICHLMYSPLSQKNLNCVLTSNGWNSPQSFLRCSSQVTILQFGSNKTFHFFIGLTD